MFADESAGGAPCDIWSLGATIVEIITGHPPYRHLGVLEAVFQIIEGETSPIPEGISPNLHSFLSMCFQRDPALRPKASELMTHPWILSHCKSQSNVTVGVQSIKTRRFQVN
jgi:serine/threonine protein kinase